MTRSIRVRLWLSAFCFTWVAGTLAAAALDSSSDTEHRTVFLHLQEL